jgi:hypothetical protein
MARQRQSHESFSRATCRLACPYVATEPRSGPRTRSYERDSRASFPDKGRSSLRRGRDGGFGLRCPIYSGPSRGDAPVGPREPMMIGGDDPHSARRSEASIEGDDPPRPAFHPPICTLNCARALSLIQAALHHRRIGRRSDCEFEEVSHAALESKIAMQWQLDGHSGNHRRRYAMAANCPLTPIRLFSSIIAR